MTVVTFPDITTSFKLALQEYLASYFDGNTHFLSDQEILFPAVDFIFDANKIIPLPTSLTIAILGDNISSFEEYKCLNPNFPNGNLHGVEVWATLLRSVIIFSPIETRSATKNRKYVDEIWSKLWAIFACDYSGLSTRKIFFPQFDILPNDVVSKPDLIEASGTLICQIRTSFARYNTVTA